MTQPTTVGMKKTYEPRIAIVTRKMHLVEMTKILSCIDINRIYGLLLIFMIRSVADCIACMNIVAPFLYRTTFEFSVIFLFIMRNHKMNSFFARFNFECVLLAHNATSESVVCRDNNCHFKWNVEHFLHVEMSVFCCLACFVSIQICSVFMSCMLPNN